MDLFSDCNFQEFLFVLPSYLPPQSQWIIFIILGLFLLDLFSQASKISMRGIRTQLARGKKKEIELKLW